MNLEEIKAEWAVGLRFPSDLEVEMVEWLIAEVERLQNVCDVASVTINSKFDRARKDTATRCAEIADWHCCDGCEGIAADAIRKEFNL